MPAPELLGQTLSGGTAERRYKLHDSSYTTDTLAFAALLAVLPATVGAKVLNYESIRVEELATCLWIGSAQWVVNTYTLIPDDTRFNFDTTGGKQTITHSISTQGSYAAGSSSIPDFGGAINVEEDKVRGVELDVRQFSFSVTYRKAGSDFTTTLLSNLYYATGTMNSDAVTIVASSGATLTFQPGELLCHGATGEPQSNNEWEYTVRFTASPNVTALPIDDITVTTKLGHDYLWVYYTNQVDAATGLTLPKARSAYVERVYAATAMNSLFTNV